MIYTANLSATAWDPEDGEAMEYMLSGEHHDTGIRTLAEWKEAHPEVSEVKVSILGQRPEFRYLAFTDGDGDVFAVAIGDSKHSKPGPKRSGIGDVGAAVIKHGGVAKAARSLGVPSRTLWDRLRKSGEVTLYMAVSASTAEWCRSNPIKARAALERAAAEG